MHASQIPNLTGYRHGCFRFGRVVGLYRGEPQYVVTCEACLRRHTVRTASSMFNSRQVTCGCRRRCSRRFRLLRTVMLPMIFGLLKVTGVASEGRVVTYTCRCHCGADVLASEPELRAGVQWACPSCATVIEAQANAA